MQGVVGGPSTMPQFALTGGVSRGVTLTDVSGGGEIEFTAATCERLEGKGVNWDQAFAGAATISDTVWWAVRSGSVSDPGVFFDAVAALRAKVSDILARLADGQDSTGIARDVEPLMNEAEGVASTLNRSEGCGLAFYRSVIAAEIGRLLDYFVDNPHLNTVTFSLVVLMAVRAGLMGSGSETVDGSTEARVMEAIAERIAAAIDARDPDTLDYLANLSGYLGWEDLHREAILGIVEVGY